MQTAIRVLGIEVVQSIQNLDNEIELLAGKQTIVRVYVRPTELAVDMPVTGTIELRAGKEVDKVRSDLSIQLRTDAIDDDDDVYVEAQRRSLGNSLNFRLNADQTKAGKVEIRLAQVTPLLAGDSGKVEIEGKSVEVTFKPGPTLRMRAVGLRVRDPKTGAVNAPKPAHFKALRSYLERAFPVSTVEWSEITVDAAEGFEPPYSGGPDSIPDPGPDWQRKFDIACTQIMAIRARDIEGGLDQRTHYYGMIYHPDYFFVGAVSNVPDGPRPDTVGVGPAELEDGSYGAHELAHALGRLHPGFGKGQTDEDPNFPPAYHGKLSSDDGKHSPHHGLDVGDSIQGARVLPFDECYDLMTYGSPLWVSDYTYNGLLERLRAEDDLGAKGEAGDFLQVVGTYDIDSRDGTFNYLFPVRTRSLAAKQNKGRVVVVGLDEKGKELSRWNVESKRAQATDLPQNTGAFQIAVARDKLAKLELRVDDFTVAERTLRVAAPLPKGASAKGPTMSVFKNGDIRISPPDTSPNDPYLLQITWPTLYDRDWRHTVQARMPSEREWQTVAVDITDDTTQLLLDRRRFDLEHLPVYVQILRTEGASETPIYEKKLTVTPRKAPYQKGGGGGR